MSKEKKIRKWIESHYSEEDERNLQEIKQKLGLPYSPPKKRKTLGARKILVFCSCAASGILILFLTLFFTVWKNDPITPENKSRYCTSDQYEPHSTDLTLKEYMQLKNLDVLSLDLYENVIPQTTLNNIYILNDTQEEIAFREYMMVFLQPSSVYTITYYVTDDYTELEELIDYKISCINTQQVHQTTIHYSHHNSIATMRWEYKGYRYYLTIAGAESSDVAFEIVGDMFQN